MPAHIAKGHTVSECTASGMVRAVRRLPMQQPSDTLPMGIKKNPWLGRARGFRVLSSWWLPFLRGGS